MKENIIIIILILIIILYFLYIWIHNKEKFTDKTLKKKRIHIWHSELGKSTMIKFMYKPVIITIQKLLNKLYKNIEIIYNGSNFDVDDIKQNEILIWVGIVSEPDFNIFKNMGIYTIYYNTEPHFIKNDSNEIWTYSKYMLKNYVPNNNQIIKYVPIIHEENIPFVPYSLKKDNLPLIFFGDLRYRPNKVKILMESNLIKNNLKQVYNIWNDEKFNKYISQNPIICINLTKEDNNILPSFRINKLLSHKCIIISEYTNDDDAELYKGMIYFCNLNEVKYIYNYLLNKTNLELIEESNKIYELFYEKFNCTNAIKLIT